MSTRQARPSASGTVKVASIMPSKYAVSVSVCGAMMLCLEEEEEGERRRVA